MNTDELQAMTTDELLARYTEKAVAQYDALESFDTKTFNRLFRITRAIEKVLASRPGDERRALLRLYAHSNLQVRLSAAQATRSVAPAEARKMLEAIKAMKWYPQSMDASFSLRAWDEGFWKPD